MAVEFDRPEPKGTCRSKVNPSPAKSAERRFGKSRRLVSPRNQARHTSAEKMRRDVSTDTAAFRRPSGIFASPTCAASAALQSTRLRFLRIRFYNHACESEA